MGAPPLATNSSLGQRLPERDLTTFTTAALQRVGVPRADAETTAAVLVASDVRGIASHGVARLDYYLTMIEEGMIDPAAVPTVLRQSATTAILDARNGLGQPVSVQAMTLALDKAALHDVGIVSVRHSNHYGIAGYYAMMALEREMIGISCTNTHPGVAPTGGRSRVYGTNPIAIAMPTAGPYPYVLDMATSVVPYGKLEVAARRGEALAPGWALDEHGQVTTDTARALDGALLPLGGDAITSGYKGYGLAIAIELFSAVLPGATYGPLVTTMWHPERPSDLGQFFMAINVAAFDEPAAFKDRAADLLARIKSSPLAEGATEILVAGEKEQRATALSRAEGVLVEWPVIRTLEEIALRLGVPSPFAAV
jgi:L-2-hydroxycarboxylate dehydrogenase (NAD+)